MLASAGTAHAAQMPRAGGPQRNDVYLPRNTQVVRELNAGDREFLLALEPGPAQDGHLAKAFEGWHEALVLAAPGDAVPVGVQLDAADRLDGSYRERIDERWPDRDLSFGRRTEAVEYAVLRRLAGLEAEHITEWRARFGALALDRLQRVRAAGGGLLAPQRAAMRALEREFPATSSALRADLWLFEDAVEQGRPRAARTWLERAALQAALLGEQRWQTALASRTLLLDALQKKRRRGYPRWTTTQSFTPDSKKSHRLVLPGRYKPRAMARTESQPGLAFLDDGRVLVQATGTCWLLAGDQTRQEDRIFEPWRLAEELGHPITRRVDQTGRDWLDYPLAASGALYLVSGRTDGQSSNLLQRIRPPQDLELPTAVWSLGGEGLFHENGAHAKLEDVLAPGLWEFQPGPILVEGVLLVQARQWITSDEASWFKANSPGEAKSWLIALDAATGLPLWKRYLCRGTDLTTDFGSRIDPTRMIRTPALPLRASTTMVLVGTNLGAGFLVELADGRLVTSFANDRRLAEEHGWRDAGRPESWVQPSAAHPVMLWAPADASELYGLRAGLDFSARGTPAAPRLLPQPPLAIGEGEALLGGNASEVLVYGRAGARRTLSSHNLETGSRIDSIYLASDETPLVGALISEDKILFATDAGLYRLDRRRELYLEVFHPLRMRSEFAPGGLWSRGNDLYLLAMGQLFRFDLQ